MIKQLLNLVKPKSSPLQPVRVRVAIEDFQAKCLKCDTIFYRAN